MADKPELTGMALLKYIRSRIQNKQTVSTDERRWYDEQNKASKKYRKLVEGK